MRCVHCWEDKPEADYQTQNRVATKVCAACRKIDRNNQYHKDYQKTPPGRSIYQNYGIGPDDYDRILAEQDGKCAICIKPLVKVHIDHCHDTGIVRGFLCMTCNMALGKFKDDPDRLRRAADYLEKSRPEGFMYRKLKVGSKCSC